MRLLLLTAVTMIAFAANSVLNRMALDDAGMGPGAFAAIRLGSGALALWLMVAARGGTVPLAAPGRIWGVASLALYILGFSFAYVTLDAGLGALILFAGVQVTMFAGGLLGGERPAPARWIGAAVALSGLALLLWPEGAAAPDPLGALLMAAAALGWGVYSLIGRGARDPLAATAANFLCAAPMAILVYAVFRDDVTGRGTLLAVLSGVVTSGMGYALWYSVLPRIAASSAALAQLTVPVIAVAGGLLILGEVLSLRLVLAGLLVIGGVAYGVLAPRRG